MTADATWSAIAQAVWLLPLLLGVAGLLGAWLTVLLLVHPVRERGIPGLFPVRGAIPAGEQFLLRLVEEQVLPALSSPRWFFEQLGPDRFRREFARSLRERIDEHVDAIMARRNERAWLALSTYARNRVYAHVHRRLPYAVDDFVEHVQAEMDDLVQPRLLVRRDLERHPDTLAVLFLEVFGGKLRRLLPHCMLAGVLAGGAVALLLSVEWRLPLAFAAASAAGAGAMLWALLRPRQPGGFWPFRAQGLLHRDRSTFMAALANRLAERALSWRSVGHEIVHGTHAGRVRHILRREVSGVLDVPVFKMSLQLVLGAQGMVELKASSLERMFEVLETTPVSAGLREHYHQEVLASLQQAARDVPGQAYGDFWEETLAPARRVLPVIAGFGGFGLGWIVKLLLGG